MATFNKNERKMGLRRTIGKFWGSFKELTICQVLLAVVFLTSGIVIDIVQGTLYITIRPWNPRLYRKLNYYVTYTLNIQVVFLANWWSQSSCKLFINPNDLSKNFGKEHAILLLNHTYEIDWVMGWLVCDRVGVLGNARVYVKKILAYAPVLGWSWKFQEIVFLERDWEKDKQNLAKQLNNLVNYPDPMWLTLFPEGTRFTKEKHEASMIVARSKGLPELKHHLLPRTRGFVASMPHLREKVPALYDVVVAVDPENRNEPSMYSILKGRAVRAKIMIRRWPISCVPEEEKECIQWLQERYQEKDQLLGDFKRTGKFLPEDSPLKGRPEYEGFEEVEFKKRIWSLLLFSSWSVGILVPLFVYLLGVLMSGNYAKMGIIAGLVIAANMGLMKLVDLTRISKGSSYGGSGKQGSPSPSDSPTSNGKPLTNGKTLSNGNGVLSNGKAKVH